MNEELKRDVGSRPESLPKESPEEAEHLVEIGEPQAFLALAEDGRPYFPEELCC